MSIPFNKADFERFLKLAKCISDYGSKGEISIYISKDSNGGSYVSLELKGRELPENKVLELL